MAEIDDKLTNHIEEIIVVKEIGNVEKKRKKNDRNISPQIDTEEIIEVKEVENIEKKRKNDRKLSPIRFLPVDETIRDSEDLELIKTPGIVRNVKNIMLVEGDPLDTKEMEKKRGMKNFPIADCLSAKIKTANGTDYSNHFIEQYFNRPAITSTRNKVIKNDLKKCGAIRLSKKKKVSGDDFLVLKSNKKKRQEENIIDESSNSSVEIIGHKNVVNNSVEKCNSKTNQIQGFPKLVAYSSSSEVESSSEDKSCSENSFTDEEENTVAKTRLDYIQEGLIEDKFKFEFKTKTTLPHKRKFK